MRASKAFSLPAITALCMAETPLESLALIFAPPSIASIFMHALQFASTALCRGKDLLGPLSAILGDDPALNNNYTCEQ